MASRARLWSLGRGRGTCSKWSKDVKLAKEQKLRLERAVRLGSRGAWAPVPRVWAGSDRSGWGAGVGGEGVAGWPWDHGGAETRCELPVGPGDPLQPAGRGELLWASRTTPISYLPRQDISVSRRTSHLAKRKRKLLCSEAPDFCDPFI